MRPLITWLFLVFAVVGFEKSNANQKLEPERIKDLSSRIHRTEYFADFPFWESPLQPAQFSSPITAQEAQSRIHLQVGYDRFNRVIDIQAKQGSRYKTLGNFFQSLYIHTVHTQIEYRQDKTIQRFYNRFGNRVTAWGNVWEKTYHKDDKGRYVRMDFTDSSGMPIENSWGILFYQWQYLMDGSVIESRFSQSGELKKHRPGFEFERIRLVYASDGTLRIMENVDEQLNPIASKSGAAAYHYFYDSYGRFERWEVYNAEGKPAIGPTNTAGEYYTYKTNQSGRITFFNQTGGPAIHHSGAVHWLMSYDQYGNIASLKFFDENNKPINGKFNHATIEYVWDSSGYHLLYKNYYDSEGKLTTHLDGFSKVQYVYNDKGLLDETRFLDADGKLVTNAYQKAAVIKNQYDQNFALLGSVKLGVDRKPLVDEILGN